MKLKSKLVLMFTSVIVIVNLAIMGVVFYTTKNDVYELAEKRLKTISDISYKLFEERNQGAWSVKENKLYKGKRLVNDNATIVDRVAVTFGGEMGILLDNVIVATTLIKDNKKAVGLEVPERITEPLQRGQNYIGITEVTGKRLLVVFTPIRDVHGNVVGSYFMGVPESEATEDTENAILGIIKSTFIICSLVVALSVIVIYVFSGRVSKRLNVLTDHVVLASKGGFLSGY